MSARRHAARTQVRLVLAQLGADRGRLVASALAVAIGAAFVVTSVGLTASSDRAVLEAVASQYSSAAAVVATPDDPTVLSAAADRLEATGATVVVDRGAAVQVVPLGQPDGAGRQLSVLGVTAPGPLRWERALTGRLPARAGEVAVGGPSGLAVGDTVQASAIPTGNIDPQSQAAVVAQPLTVVGTVDVSGDLARGVGARLLVTADQAQALGAAPGQLRVAAIDGRSAAATLDDVRRTLTQDPTTRDLRVGSGADTAHTVARTYAGGTAGVTAGLGVFVVIALLVSGLVTANTFTVVLAQRVREVALLRCVGASSRQVGRGLLGEALLLGVGASVLGAAVGAGLTAVISVVLGRSATAIPLGAVVIPLHALLLAVLTGTLTCVMAALVPARSATRVAPLAALRPVTEAAGRTRGALRTAVAGGLGATSLLVLLLAARASELGVAVAAGVVSFGAVALLLVRGAALLAGGLGRVLAPVGGVPAVLAAAAVRRHPLRTASATLVLLVGITLMSAVVVGGASTRATADIGLGAAYPVDVVIRAGTSPLPADLGDRLGAIAGVGAWSSVTRAEVQVDGRSVDAIGVDPVASARVTRSALGVRLPAVGQVVVPLSIADLLGVIDGTPLTVSGTGGSTQLTVTIGPTGSGSTALAVAQPTLDALGTSAPDQAWIRLADNLDDARSQQTLAALAQVSAMDAPGAEITANVTARLGRDAVLTTLLVLVTALLAVSVLIALIGLANTLALSAVERRRESAVLRALGTSRGQLGATVVWEAVLVSAVAGALGVLLGAGYGLVGVRAGLGALHVVLPWGELGLLLLGAVTAGVLAALLPAWRTTRGAVVAGLAQDR